MRSLIIAALFAGAAFGQSYVVMDKNGNARVRTSVTVGAVCPGGAPAGSVCAVKVYGDASAMTGLAGGGDMVASAYITAGAGVPANPCATRGIQYWNTSTTPFNVYNCPSAGGNWLGPVSFGAGGGGTWGSITGTLSAQSDLNTALGLKVPTSRTVNGQALSSDVVITTITGNAGTAAALAANGTNCSAGNYPLGVDAAGNAEGCTAATGSGDTTGAASSTDTAVARFSGTGGKTLQNSGVLIDGSNNVTTPGFISSGSGSGAAGGLQMLQGTAPSIVANTVTRYAPTSVTGYNLRELGSAATGFLFLTNTSNDMVSSVVGSTGSNNVVLSTSPTLVTPALGTPSSVNLANATNLPDTALSTTVQHKYLGTAAPGSVAGNLPGDSFTDTTNHHDYVCNAPSGTTAPACTSVATAGWLQRDNSSGAAVTSFNTRTGAVTGAAGDIPETMNAQTGTTYTVVTGDNGKTVTLSNASAVAITLPQAGTTGFAAGWGTTLKNLGVGTVTVTPTTSTISGAATITLETGEWAKITNDGTNYEAFGNRTTQGSNVTLTKTRTGVSIASTAGGGNMSTTGANTMGAAGTIDASGQTGADSFKMPSIAGCTPTAVGSICRDSTQKTNVVYSETWAGVASLPKLVYHATPAADTVCTQAETGCTNSGTTTDLAFTSQPTLPSTAWIAGKALRVSGSVYAVAGTGSATTVTVKVKLGGVTIYSGPATSGGGSAVTQGSDFSFTITPATISSSGTLYCTSTFNNNALFPVLRNAAANPTTINMTASQTLTITVQFSVVSALDIVKLVNLQVWEEN